MIVFENADSVLEALEERLKELERYSYERLLNRYGNMGVRALSANTPKDTGETAGSWHYEVRKNPEGTYTISWFNRVMAGSVPLVILLHYGHGTGTGGYVRGTDFINPAIKPVFDKILAGITAEVKL